MIIRFTALKIKLQDVRDLAEEKLLDEVVMVREVPVVQTLDNQKNSLILQRDNAWKRVNEIVIYFDIGRSGNVMRAAV